MENFIGEGKQGFDFAAVSSRNKTVNSNLLQLHALATASSTGSGALHCQDIWAEASLIWYA